MNFISCTNVSVRRQGSATLSIWCTDSYSQYVRYPIAWLVTLPGWGTLLAYFENWSLEDWLQNCPGHPPVQMAIAMIMAAISPIALFEELYELNFRWSKWGGSGITAMFYTLRIWALLSGFLVVALLSLLRLDFVASLFTSRRLTKWILLLYSLEFEGEYTFGLRKDVRNSTKSKIFQLPVFVWIFLSNSL